MTRFQQMRWPATHGAPPDGLPAGRGDLVTSAAPRMRGRGKTCQRAPPPGPGPATRDHEARIQDSIEHPGKMCLRVGIIHLARITPAATIGGGARPLTTRLELASVRTVSRKCADDRRHGTLGLRVLRHNAGGHPVRDRPTGRARRPPEPYPCAGTISMRVSAKAQSRLGSCRVAAFRSVMNACAFAGSCTGARAPPPKPANG